MGMCTAFSRSSYDYDKVDVVKKIKNLPNPNPNNYKIIQSHSENNWLLLKVNYPDCTNYEGNKLLLFRNTSLSELSKQKVLDPHFSNNDKFISPFARFEPSEDGWNMAIKFMETKT